MKRTALFLIAIVLYNSCYAQDTALAGKPATASRYIFNVSVGGHYGFIFAHSQAVQNTKGSYPYGAELILSWQRNDRKAWDLCHCYPRKGLLLAWYNYDNAILGSGWVSAYLLEPTYRLGKRLFFSFKGAAGLVFLTNPYDVRHNADNMSYSTTISGYLQLGTGIWIGLSDKWWINPSITYQHSSNGGLREPNKGINWPTAALSINYTPHPQPFYRGERAKDKYWKGLSPRWDAGLFGMMRQSSEEDGNKRNAPLVGLLLQGSKQVGRINALTLGLEISGDRSLYQQLKEDSIHASSIRVGLLGGNEFLLGKFIFSQRLGVYLFDQTPYFDALFHCWGINYRMNKHLAIGFNLKAHRQVAEYIDLRFVYSFVRPAR